MTDLSLLREERFTAFKGEIEDEDTARRIENGQRFRVESMAKALDDLYHSARLFSNAVFSGHDPDYDDLSEVMDSAHHALYEWKKNETRLDAWEEWKRRNDLHDC